MRIMCRRGFEMDFAELLLEDYKASLKYLSERTRFGTISKVCSLALATENIVLNTLQNKTGAVPTGIPF